MSHGIAFAIGAGIGFVCPVVLHLPGIHRSLRTHRRRRVVVHLIAWVVVPVVVAALMPTFIDAILVLLGNAVGGAVSTVVTLPITLALAKRAGGSGT